MAVSCAIAGCASVPPPLSELSAAEARIATARELRAARYAQADLDAAESKLQLARTAIDAKDYDLANQQIEQAQAGAELAAAKAREAQAREQVRRKTEDNARLRRQLAVGGGR
ncbi:MAG: DUF4398 domain-containing protein [Xanthomonadaceae bacterium]|nr:DUF4398 domain-containing protein [Xanthomonadaceae bacterium]